MLSGPPLPLPHDIPLHQLLACARQPGTLGAWVRGSVRTLHLYESASGASHRLLIGPDLGHLLSRCDRVALREGGRAVVLDAEAVIRWRVLQVVTATPHLPPLERLDEIFPGAQLNSSGFQVAMSSRSPEHILAECLTHGIPVRESWIIYDAPAPPRPAALDRVLPASSADLPPPPPLRSASGTQPSSAVRPTRLDCGPDRLANREH
jgi:hypothetical protein